MNSQNNQIKAIVKLWDDYEASIPTAELGTSVFDEHGRILNISATMEGFMNYLSKRYSNESKEL